TAHAREHLARDENSLLFRLKELAPERRDEDSLLFPLPALPEAAPSPPPRRRDMATQPRGDFDDADETLVDSGHGMAMMGFDDSDADATRPLSAGKQAPGSAALRTGETAENALEPDVLTDAPPIAPPTPPPITEPGAPLAPLADEVNTVQYPRMREQPARP